MNHRLIKISISMCLVFILISWLSLLSSVIFNDAKLLARQSGATTTDVDVAAFWAAAVFAWNGTPQAAFDLNAMRALQAHATTGGAFVYSWLYPPAVMLILMPLGAMSFIGAWITLVITSIFSFRAALNNFNSSYEILNFIVLFSPATLYCALRGQLSMLLAAALLTGFSHLIRRREVRAAVWLSLVTLKPQLCLALPVALAVSQSWRLIALGIVFVVALSVAPLPIVGFGYWAAWLDAIEAQDAWLDSVKAQSDMFVKAQAFSMYSLTWTAFFINLGFEHVAERLQWLFSFLMLAMMATVWATQRSSPQLRAAAFLFAMIGVSPYAWTYEVLFPLLGALVLLQTIWTPEGKPGHGSWIPRVSAVLFVAVWLGPLVTMAKQPISISMMPLSLAGLILTLVLSRRIVCPSDEPEVQPETGQG